MSDATTTAVRTYRLAPPDRTGWMLGLSLTQLVAVAAGIVAGTVLMITISVPAGFAVMVLLCGLGIVKVHGSSLIELTPQLGNYIGLRRGGRTGWHKHLPVLGGDSNAPPALAGLELVTVDSARYGTTTTGEPIAVSHDQRAGAVSATLRVSGRQFGLVERSAQDWLVTQWGNALQGFVSESRLIRSIRWSEWAAPAGVDEHRQWLTRQLAADALDDALGTYHGLLHSVARHSVRHDVLVTVTVDTARSRSRDRSAQGRLDAAIDALLREVRLFASRLQDAQLVVSAPLGPHEWARAMRLRLDPTCRLALDARRRALRNTAGECHPDSAGPLAARSEWTAWQVDASWHRGLYVADWPRLDVAAGWLSDLILYAQSVRTVTVVFEPIPRSRSQRAIVRDAAKLESDAQHRAEKGFRVGAHHRRARRSVEEREEELVAGYSEFSYAGIVTVSAPTLETLDAHTAELVQVAASIGVDLRPLNGRHDQAVAATLPIARGLVPKALL